MWMTNVSPSALAGSPVESCNIPDASMATCPDGDDTTPKIVAASAGMVRCTSKRSLMSASWHQPSERAPAEAGGELGVGHRGPGADGDLTGFAGEEVDE